MSRILIIAFGLFTGATTAHAAPFLHVTKASGFVPPQYSYQLDCSVDANLTVVKSRVGESGRWITRFHPTRYTRALFGVGSIRRSLFLAARGRLVTTPGPTDLPTASYYGLIGSRRIPLYLDRGTQRIRNTAPGVQSLIQLANMNCPTPL